MAERNVARLLADERTNAAIGWACVGVAAAVAARSLVVGDLLWAIFATAVVVLALVPPVVVRSPRVMLPWEVLALAAFPVLVDGFTGQTVGDLTGYLSVAALALVLAVDLDVFSGVEMNDAFAVLFVVVTTMATAGVWAVTRWVADGVLATGFIRSEEALMWEFVASTVAGIGAGLVFAFYVRRHARPVDRLPEGPHV